MKVAMITRKVAMILMKVATITTKVERISKNVLVLSTSCMKILVWQPHAFAKGCFLVREIESKLGGNWIVATIRTKVETIIRKVATISVKVAKITTKAATITKNVLVQKTACMKTLIWHPHAFAKGSFL